MFCYRECLLKMSTTFRLASRGAFRGCEMGMVIAVGRLSARSNSVITGRKARKFCTIIPGRLDQKAEIVEGADQSSQYFEFFVKIDRSGSCRLL
ncbi:hypothetical protein GA0061102_10441 [Rhizobium miluonense]|uniref:Uncharacterized protein n=1 Tax=Rhizobium miluonense TaxID=411945 RepID=A0A1C3WWJ3_9HYPH|nr:hypothetical protein GA0061102_10441 [Rhizobium miluonense]